MSNEKTVTVFLTEMEAIALDALVNESATRLFTRVNGLDDYDPKMRDWAEQDAARACDKLRSALLGHPTSFPWEEHIRNLLPVDGEPLHLNPAEQENFARTMLEPPAATERLQQAAKAHRERSGH